MADYEDGNIGSLGQLSDVSVHLKDSRESVLLQAAMSLYSYGNFSQITNNADYARECMKRSHDFVGAAIKGNSAGTTGEVVNVHVCDTASSVLIKVAEMLYSYGDFNEIENPSDYARECLKRANDFVEVVCKTVDLTDDRKPSSGGSVTVDGVPLVAGTNISIKNGTISVVGIQEQIDGIDDRLDSVETVLEGLQDFLHKM